MVHWMEETINRVVVGVLMPIHDFLTDGGSRYYWVYCLTGLLIAAYAYSRHRGVAAFRTTLADKNVWLSASSINDYVIVVLTPVLRLTVLSWTVLNWKTVSAFVVSLLHAAGVSGTVTDGSAIGLGVLLTLTLFVVDDFFRWYVHYLFHRIPELWEFHKVHHSAEVLNFATSERHHPVEVIITSALLAVVYGTVNGVFIAVFGDKLTVTSVAGANVFLFAFNVCGGVLRHSPFWISFGPSIERWIISPAMHQIHHSSKTEHFDRNMGGSLAIWDRMFGTLHIPKDGEIENYGIGAETTDFRSLEVIFLRPFIAAGDLVRRRFKPASGAPRPQPSSLPV